MKYNEVWNDEDAYDDVNGENGHLVKTYKILKLILREKKIQEHINIQLIFISLNFHLIKKLILLLLTFY